MIGNMDAPRRTRWIDESVHTVHDLLLADHVSTRLAPELADRLDRVAVRLRERSHGAARVSRSDVLRAALTRGLDALEHEIDGESRQLGLSGPPGTKGGTR